MIIESKPSNVLKGKVGGQYSVMLCYFPLITTKTAFVRQNWLGKKFCTQFFCSLYNNNDGFKTSYHLGYKTWYQLGYKNCLNWTDLRL